MSKDQCKRDFHALENRRKQGMKLLGSGWTQAEIARLLRVSRQTVSKWAKLLQDDPNAWRSRPVGRPASLTFSERSWLGKMLLKGPQNNGLPDEYWTLASVGQLIAREFGPTYSNVHVMRLLRELGYSCRKPRKDAIQHGEKTISHTKKIGLRKF